MLYTLSQKIEGYGDLNRRNKKRIFQAVNNVRGKVVEHSRELERHDVTVVGRSCYSMARAHYEQLGQVVIHSSY